MPAPTPNSHGKEEGLCHRRLALGAALGEVGTNMMGDGRMVSPPLAEGGEPIVVPESLTFTGCHRMPQQGRTSRHALSRLQNCATRDIWYGRFPLHTFT